MAVLQLKSTIARWRWLLVWVRRHPWRTLGLMLLLCFLALNFLAYQHSHAMLTYKADADPTPSPETLSAWQKMKVLICGVTVSRPENTRSPQDLDVPSETLCIPSDGGVSLEGWLLVPSNPRGTVMLFHGYAASRSNLLEEARAFNEMGLTAVLIDFRGSGGSNGHTTSLGYEEAEDVAALVRHVRSLGLAHPLILYGQSMGGAAVVRSIVFS